MKTHPLAQIVPVYSADELDRLAESMTRSGFDPHRPVITHEGMILDGRHRHAAAIKAKVEPTFEEWSPAFDGDTPALFVLRSTIHRTLTPTQRAALAVELMPHIEADAMKRMKAGKSDPTQKIVDGRRERESVATAAKEAGTNREYVRVAAKAKEESPETFEKLNRAAVSSKEARQPVHTA